MKKIVLSVLAISASALCSFAQTGEWSYQDCVDYAREHNITLKQSQLTEESAQYSLEAARAQWTPSLNFSTSQGYTNTPFADSGYKNAYNSSYGLNAGWTVWNGGSRENTIKKSELQTKINELNTYNIFRNLETEILSLYINILYSREAIDINKEAAEVSYAQAERARQLMEMGKLSRVDYQQIQSQYEQDRYSVVNAEGSYDSQRMQMKKLLELGLSQQITLQNVEWTREQVLAALPDMFESYQLAMQTDANLQATDLQIQSAEYSEKIAKAERLPSIDLNAGVGTGYSSPGSSFGNQMKKGLNETIGLTVSVPILDNKKAKVAIAQANIDKLNAELDKEARQNEIAQTVEGLYIDLRAAQARYISGEEQIKSTKLSDELVNEQFKLGLVNTVELITAHNAYLQARRELLQSKYLAMLDHKLIEYYRTAAVTMP
jgi:outer membrane protein